jgi:AcrR family transcriptional regulator
VVQFPALDGEAFPPVPSFTSPTEQRRDDILRAAMTAFNQNGFPGASIDQIAALAQVTRATIYRYFGNKEELLFHCMRRADAFNQAAVDQVPAGRDVVDQEIWLRRFLFHGHTTAAGPVRTYALLASLTRPPAGADGQHRQRHRVGPRPDHPRHRAGLLSPSRSLHRRAHPLGAVQLVPCLVPGDGPCTAIEIADHHTALFLYGLKPRPPQTRFMPAAAQG